MQKLLPLLTAILSTVLAVGCNTGGPFTIVPVGGVITYEDGSPIPIGGMRVYFHSLTPPKNGMHPRPAAVDVGSDGMFEKITTHKFGDGLAVGEHKVTFVALENGKETKKIPKDYMDVRRTPLVVNVTHSGQVLEIKVPKP